LIAFHYDNKKLALGLYKYSSRKISFNKFIALNFLSILREFVLLWSGIINDYDIVEVKKLLNTLDRFRLDFKENIINLISHDYIFSVIKML